MASKEANVKYRAKLKQQVLNHYGRVCACCGEANEKFLTIDHANDDGAEHRRKIGRQSNALHLFIIREGFPSYFQVLCWNCNSGRHNNGGVCPHLEE